MGAFNIALDYIVRTTGASVNTVVENAREAAATFGKSALHTLAPDNFEYYMCSLELLDSAGSSKGLIYFVVMPNNISENNSRLVNVTKTNAGVSTLFNETFVPKDISIQGTFGRKFRLLMGMKEVGNVSTIPLFGGNMMFGVLDDASLVKSGYGLIKMLKKMIDSSHKLDDKGNPLILIFNNYAFNSHYVVEVMQDSYQQSTENNMIWYYSLEMKAVAPASAIFTQEQTNQKLLTMVASKSIAKGLTNIINDTTRAAIGPFNIDLMRPGVGSINLL